MIIIKELKKVNIMSKSRTKKVISTFDRLMRDPKQKALFEKEYNKFLLSEFILEAMEENKISVRKLAEKSGVSPSIIQNIRSEKTSNVTFNTLNSIFSSLGYRMVIEKINRSNSDKLKENNPFKGGKKKSYTTP
jgi:DNA-binding Xre family transcriptional regulator